MKVGPFEWILCILQIFVSCVFNVLLYLLEAFVKLVVLGIFLN